VFTASQQFWFFCIATAVVAFVLWHATLVVTVGVPVAAIGVTLRALMEGAPLTLRGYEPASTAATLTVYLTLMVAAGVGAGWLLWRTPRRKPKTVGFADQQETKQSAGEVRARSKAAWTRRGSIAAGTLNVATAPLHEVGMLLGHTTSHAEPVILTLEDQVGVMAPTGAGKSLHLMIGACLDAPGPVVATSTSPELLDAITEARTKLGTVWVFDPLDMARFPDRMVWNPVTGCERSQTAVSRGEAFAAGLKDTGDGGNSQFFRDAAARIMARLLHAAALGDKNMNDVLRWAVTLGRGHEALDILKSHRSEAETMWEETLEHASTGADDTVANTRMTLGQKVEHILSRLVLRQMIPTGGIQEFDPAAFVQSTDTLIIVTDDQAETNVAALTTMLLAAVIDAAKSAAAMSETGRLDPPLRVAGDEIANVAPLPKLPALISNTRGSGVQWVLALQSLAQILARWGRDDGRQLFVNLNCWIVLGGLMDGQALEAFSDLVGSVDVTEVTTNMDAGNTTSGSQVTTTERTALRPEEIRGLDDGQALVIYRNTAAMIINLIPWTDRPDGDLIAAGIRRVRAARIGRTP
jgi:type IV secretory pathway TraG/TraD family ATPase VirD4